MRRRRLHRAGAAAVRLRLRPHPPVPHSVRHVKLREVQPPQRARVDARALQQRARRPGDGRRALQQVVEPVVGVVAAIRSCGGEEAQRRPHVHVERGVEARHGLPELPPRGAAVRRPLPAAGAGPGRRLLRERVGVVSLQPVDPERRAGVANEAAEVVYELPGLDDEEDEGPVDERGEGGVVGPGVGEQVAGAAAGGGEVRVEVAEAALEAPGAVDEGLAGDDAEGDRDEGACRGSELAGLRGAAARRRGAGRAAQDEWTTE